MPTVKAPFTDVKGNGYALLVMLSLSVMLVACGNGASGGANVDREAMVDGLAEGDYQVSLEGAVQRTGDYQGERGPVEFRPVSDGTNSEGPYQVRIRSETDFDGDRRMGYLMIVLPRGAEPGTYMLTARRDADEDQAYAIFRFSGTRSMFSRDVVGTIDIADLGDVLTAGYDVELADGDGNTMTVAGRTHSIPFTPQAETSTTFTADGEVTRFEGGDISTRNDTITIGSLASGGIQLRFPDDVQPGTYALQQGRDGDGVRVRLAGFAGDYGHGVDAYNGEVTLRQDGDLFSGTFHMAAEGGDVPVEAEGSFEGLQF